MNAHSIAPFIQQYYPEYYSIERYPADRCASFCKADGEWGILGNFGRTPLVVDGVTLKNSEQLFQLMKFKDEEPVKAVYQAGNPKYPAKKWETTHRRSDWGEMIVDVMKFCLTLKYQQSEAFRSTLLRTKGLFIVEDQTTFPKKTADTWGAKLVGNEYVGPNLLGRLLMELRDNGELKYSLPEDALYCLKYLK